LPFAGRGDQHRPHLGHVGSGGTLLVQSVTELVRQWLRSAIDFEITTEQRPAVGGQAGVNGGSQRANRGYHSNAQREAEQHDPQAANTAAKLATGDGEGKDHRPKPA
jgi:hypothetical protein